ncbi:MAG: VCBS repeat-containing protein [Acidobacteria bacterium]|nr:VCBS repeat-containing protein [Acidobacteriota bacterium]
MKTAKNIANLLFLSAAMMMAGVSTFAQTPLAVEDFDLAPGTALTSVGWSAHSGGGTNPISVVSPGLTYEGYPSSGIGNAVGLTTSGEDVNKAFPGQSSGSVYAAFLVNLSEAADHAEGGYFFHLGPDPVSTTFRGRIYARKNAENQVSFGLGKGSPVAEVVYTGYTYSLNTTYLMVLKYTVVAGAANDTVQLYINPALDEEPGTATLTATDISQSDIEPATYSLRQGSTASSPTPVVDGIRIGTSWESIMGGGSSGSEPNGPVDLDGDGYTDFVVIRNTDGSPSGPAVWYYNLNPANPSSGGPTQAIAWGLAGIDQFLTGDFDGDGKDDVAIFRQGLEAKFYILNSADFTARVEQFGTEGDYAGVVDDYNGDGVTDLAVYRPGIGPNDQSYWFYRTTPGGAVHYVPWGAGSDFPAPGDFDGDGYADFTVQRPSGGTSVFWTLYNAEGNPATPTNVVTFGSSTDYNVIGDYDGDGKADHAILRSVGGTLQWWVRPSSDPLNAVAYIWGVSATDWPVPGDYDGDGKYDPAIWRNGTFWVLTSSSGYTNFTTFGLGMAGDYPVANFRIF